MYIYPRILCDDFDATLRFYTETLGLVPEKVVPGHRYASFDFGSGTALALLDRAPVAALVGGEPAPAGGVGGLMLVVPVGDVDALVATLPAGLLLAGPEDRPGWNIRSAYLRDPAGNLVEVQSY